LLYLSVEIPLFFLLQSIGLFKPEERHKRWAKTCLSDASPSLKSPLANKATQIQSVFIVFPTLPSTLTKQIYTLMTAHLSPPERPK
jgi:hypothetical protein